jgi:Flp pilus assembly protein TadG
MVVRRRHRARGQSLVEFAFVFPVFMFILAGVIQFGVVLWGQNTLNQIVRDTGRFAATLDCTAAAKTSAETRFGGLKTAAGGPWSNATATVTYTTDAGLPTTTCPTDNTQKVWVGVVGEYDVPVFFPLPVPSHLSSTTTFRVEPKP